MLESTLIKSPNDHKHYLPLTLSNGLRVLLVNNNQSKKSAAALAVNVGHFNDPNDRQGLAHFLEHMLFLGTEKYPQGSEYQQFISQHGGSNNAWTATEHTCYFLDINHQFFEEAIDRFSQFFISPLLSPSFVQSERENIDAEYKLKLKDDIRRLYDVHKETINPAHPFSKFSVGNSKTLADRNNKSIQHELFMFYEQFYRAKAMTLVVEGPQSLDELKKIVERSFLAISDKKISPNVITAPLYLPEHKGQRIDVSPVKNEHQLIISFAMPAIDDFYRTKPESILAYLLGHEGTGSILSQLKKNQWVLALTAGAGINGSNFKDFNISLQLTKLGENYINEIVTIIFQYINLMKKKPIAAFYYQEKKTLSKNAFQFKEKLKPIDSVQQLVINMQHYPEQDTIYGDYAMDDLCNKTIKKLLAYLCPSNVRLIHVSNQNKFDQISKWYQVPYRVTPINADLINSWQQCQATVNLSLPKKNPYIIKNPSVVKKLSTITPTTPLPETSLESVIPECIDKKSGYELWFNQDTIFNVPKGYIYIGIESPIAVESDKNIAMTRLFVDMFRDSIAEKYYDAEIAGMQYHLYTHQGGMTLQLSGFANKQQHLLSLLLQDLKNPCLDESKFTLLKEHLIKHWQNSDNSKSISQLFTLLSSAMQPNNPCSKALYEALTSINFPQFLQFVQQLFNKVSIRALVHGNWNNEQASQISELIKITFSKNIHNDFSVKPSVINIHNKGEINFPIVLPNHDHATITYYPMPNKDLSTVAKTMLISQLLSPLFFKEMRTEKQYGYLVGVNFIPINRYPGIAFYIQSPETESLVLSNTIDEFIEQSYRDLELIEPQYWNHLKQGLASQLLEKDSSLRIKSQRFWATLCTEECNFNKKRQLINQIHSLTLAEVGYFFKNTLIKLCTPDRIKLFSFTNDKHLANSSLDKKLSKKNIDLLNNCERNY